MWIDNHFNPIRQMKRIILIVLVSLMAVAPAGAQFKRPGKQAKEDAKLVVSQLKEEGYKPLDNTKLDDAVKDYLSLKYSEKNCMEVVGRGNSKNLNEAKSLARDDAMSFYPMGETVSSFFVYKKSRRRYDVVCYALLRASSKASVRTTGGTSERISAARAEMDEKEARAEAKKMEQQTRKEVKKAQKKADKQAEKIRKKADKAHQKAVDKANEKAQKAIEKADRERAKALEGIKN